MISIYQKRILISTSILFCLLLCALMPVHVYAQNSTQGLTLSVTPTIFEMSASPEQVWNSSIKVINNNNHELTVYASVVNFAPEGEAGQGKFLPVFEEVTGGSTLAEWITISPEPIVIPPERSEAVPFTVAVPKDAAPGGHFAAILIGTRPPATENTLQVKTSQMVTSLFFVRIAGDVIENGTVREFKTLNTFSDTPKADFEVRFENKGNVHLQPQGEIVITNMWGKERGVIPINQHTHFGNVLPQSIRKFEFSWKGEPSFSDIGRYKASLTLGYGEENRKFTTSVAYFYVVPVKTILIALGLLLIFVWFISWSIKAYVRRMLFLAGVESTHNQSRNFVREGDVRIVKRASVRAPVEAGFFDLQNRLRHSRVLLDKIKTVGNFILAYRIFFISVFVVCVALVSLWLFIADVTLEQRDYEVVIDNGGVNTTISSEEILYDRTLSDSQEGVASTSLQEQAYELILINSGDTPGAAASLQTHLQALGYSVSDLQSDFGESKERTVIVYDTQLTDMALSLSRELRNALLSADPQSTDGSTPSITIYIGNDYTF